MNASKEENLGALLFNKKYIKEIGKICTPLFDNFNMTHFGYLRYMPDGSYLAMSSDINWAEIHLKNDYASSRYFAEEVCSIPDNTHHASLWPTFCPSDKTLDALYTHNIWHGLNVVHPSSGFVDVYYFATNRENHQVTSLYLNHSDLIRRFIAYFKNEIKNIIMTAKPENYAYSEIYNQVFQGKTLNNDGTYKNNLEKFIKETEIKKFKVYDSLNLSAREIQCMTLIASGRTMKEIGKHLSLSPRTIESYLNSLKNKLGCTHKGDIISFYEQSDLKDIYRDTTSNHR